MKSILSPKAIQFLKLSMFVFTSFAISTIVPFFVCYAIESNLMACVENKELSPVMLVISQFAILGLTIMAFGWLALLINWQFARIWEKLYIFDYIEVYQLLIKVENECERNSRQVPEEVKAIRRDLKLFDRKAVDYHKFLLKYVAYSK